MKSDTAAISGGTPHFESGKSFRREARSKRGKAINEARKVGEISLARTKAPLIEKMARFLKKKKVSTMDQDELADWLATGNLPTGWEKHKLHTKKGGRRRDPAIIIDGQGLKFSRFFKFWKTGRKLTRNKGVKVEVDSQYPSL